MGTLLTILRESLRYKGREAQWLWLFHRVSGLGILFYLLIHVFDMSLAYFNVPIHEEMIALFKTPLFSVLELAMAALLIYHAVNGVRVAILDLRPELWVHQQKVTRLSLMVTAILTAPTVVIMLIYTFNANFGHVATAITH